MDSPSAIERELFRAAEEDAEVALIYADWLEDQGRYPEALEIRALTPEGSLDGDGYGYGDGYGDGYGYSTGDGGI